MPWMRVSIGVGAVAVVAGVAGMILWIHDGSHFFDLAVAVAMAGFLTLISCVLARVFGSSHAPRTTPSDAAGPWGMTRASLRVTGRHDPWWSRFTSSAVTRSFLPSTTTATATTRMSRTPRCPRRRCGAGTPEPAWTGRTGGTGGTYG